MRTSTLAALTAVLLFVVALLAVTSPSTVRPHTTAMLDVVQAPSEDGTSQDKQPEGSAAEAKAYLWLAKFAMAKLK